jgi:hypothetical protein
MSRSHMPPVPPASRSHKGPHEGEEREARRADRDSSRPKGPPENLAEQGRQGNINQNTHHQGHQQDR